VTAIDIQLEHLGLMDMMQELDVVWLLLLLLLINIHIVIVPPRGGTAGGGGEVRRGVRR